MTYWSWWISGIALAGVMLFHWFALHRMMAVSGRVTGLIDRLRHGAPEEVKEMTPEEMMAAIQAATSEEFGAEEETIEAPVVSDEAAEGAAVPAGPGARTPAQHVLFMGGLVLGGVVATAVSGGFDASTRLRSPLLERISGGSNVANAAILLGGGALVGFGTRMSGGCTSGHGLCGTSRLQPGSLVATAAFFGAGIATSFALGTLL
jgi:hypothetical protein